MKAVVAAFNQEKALVGAFSVIVQPVVEPMELYTALCRTECQKADWAAHKPSCKKPYAVKENEKVGRWVTMNSIDNQ